MCAHTIITHSVCAIDYWQQGRGRVIRPPLLLINGLSPKRKRDRSQVQENSSLFLSHKSVMDDPIYMNGRAMMCDK